LYEVNLLAGSILRKEEHVDAAVRDLFEETGLTLTVDDFTLMSGNHLRVPLLAGKCKLVHVFSASVHVSYVKANMRTRAQVEQAGAAQSTIHHDATYVVPTTIDIDGLSLTPSESGLLKEAQREHELLHFGYVA
jgi:8-oxo-dGTP pyrophosphatase MutT (NUDIX family)